MPWPEKIEQIEQAIRQKGSLLVALSGGVDSAVVAALAYRALGQKALAVTINSPLVCSGELEDARRVAEAIGINHLIVDLDELQMADFRQNSQERCYLCKQFRFTRLGEIAQEKGYQEIADGTTASDLREFRPGLKAARELGIYHPLAEAGLSQDDTAAIAAFLKLPVAGKPHNSCLATRVPYGEELAPARLQRIDKAEGFIREVLPAAQIRVRDHGELARLEVDSDAVPYLLNQSVSRQITQRLKKLGYQFVTLDLEGYRFGSFDK